MEKGRGRGVWDDVGEDVQRGSWRLSHRKDFSPPEKKGSLSPGVAEEEGRGKKLSGGRKKGENLLRREGRHQEEKGDWLFPGGKKKKKSFGEREKKRRTPTKGRKRTWQPFARGEQRKKKKKVKTASGGKKKPRSTGRGEKRRQSRVGRGKKKREKGSCSRKRGRGKTRRKKGRYSTKKLLRGKRETEERRNPGRSSKIQGKKEKGGGLPPRKRGRLKESCLLFSEKREKKKEKGRPIFFSERGGREGPWKGGALRREVRGKGRDQTRSFFRKERKKKIPFPLPKEGLPKENAS